MLEHGGDLHRASTQYGISREQWLDLSTGINPFGYPVPPVPAQDWRRLPDRSNSSFIRAARDYYQTDGLLPVAGTQAAIQALPRLRPHSQVLVSQLTYGEHAHAWERHGHAVLAVSARAIEGLLARADVLIVCNPNNPTGELIERAQLLEWHGILAARGGWLIVDEAFIDTMPEESVAPLAARPGLITLRSLGKFFGLAGARVGFAFASSDLLSALEDALGPWTVSGPAQFAACMALSDCAWQANTRESLVEMGKRLNMLLARGDIVARGTALFQWWQDERAEGLHRELARKAILTRSFRQAEGNGIRFGLPGKEEEWQRLELALEEWRNS